MKDYSNRFFTLLERDIEREAMEDTLDKDTDPGDFDVDTTSPNGGNEDLSVQAAEIRTKQAREMKQTLQNWIDKCDEFIHFLNGTDGQSVQTKLAHAEPDTLFDRMKQSEQRKIARVATELASLAESFRGYIAQSDNPQFKHV